MAVFMIRIFKGWETRDALRRWVNTYEVEGPFAAVEDYAGIASAIVAAEKELHLTSVQFLSYTVSTWAPDSEPYNPNSFVTQGLVGTGVRGGLEASDALDTNVAFFVQRNAATGRQGKLFYRGCLLEADVEMGSDGYFRLETGSDINSGGASWGAYSAALGALLPGGALSTKLIMIGVSEGQTTPHIRNVNSLTPAGVVVNRRNHRYFDRALG